MARRVCMSLVLCMLGCLAAAPATWPGEGMLPVVGGLRRAGDPITPRERLWGTLFCREAINESNLPAHAVAKVDLLLKSAGKELFELSRTAEKRPEKAAEAIARGDTIWRGLEREVTAVLTPEQMKGYTQRIGLLFVEVVISPGPETALSGPDPARLNLSGIQRVAMELVFDETDAALEQRTRKYEEARAQNPSIEDDWKTQEDRMLDTFIMRRQMRALLSQGQRERWDASFVTQLQRDSQ
jgi:hypothetical protein